MFHLQYINWILLLLFNAINNTLFIAVVLMVCGLEAGAYQTWAIEFCNTNTAFMMEKMRTIMNMNGLERLIQDTLSIDIYTSPVMSILLLKHFFLLESFIEIFRSSI